MVLTKNGRLANALDAPGNWTGPELFVVIPKKRMTEACREDEPSPSITIVGGQRLTAAEVTLFAEGKLDMAYIIQPQRNIVLPPPPKPVRRSACILPILPIGSVPTEPNPARTILDEPEQTPPRMIGHQRSFSTPPLSPTSADTPCPVVPETPLSPKARETELGAWRIGGSRASGAVRRLTSPRPRVITTKTVVAIPIPRFCPLCKNYNEGLADIRVIGYWATRGETIYMCLKTRSGEQHPTSPTDVCSYTWTSCVKMPKCHACNVLMFVEPRIHQWVFVCKECQREAQRPDNDSEEENALNSA